MIKLGTPIKDKATGLDGMLIHMIVQTDGSRFYNFQPRGLNPENGQPVKRKWITADRVIGGIEIPEVDLPLNVLGTQVEDMASGFNGTAIAITLHINGCVHIDVQPKGIQKKTGDAMESHNFDIRLLKGKAIKALSDSERAKSEKENPSPTPMQSHLPTNR